MLKKSISLVLLICFVNNCFSQEPKDTVIMNDGMVFSGDLKSLKSGKIEFDIDDVGIVKIKFDRIKMIKSLSHVFRIETSDRKIYYGNIRRGDKPGTLRIETKDSSIIIPLNRVSTFTSFDNKTFRAISGYVSSGFNYARSSNSGRFNFDGQIRMQTKRTYSDLQGSMFLSQTDTTWVRDRENLGTNAFYMLDPWISIGGTLKYQRNFELGLARRFQEGVGLMLNLLKKNNFQIRALSGVVVNQEKNTEGFESSTQVEIPFNLYLEFFKFSHPNISVSTNQISYISLTDAGRIRWDAETRLSWEIIDDLALSIQIYHNYDSKPPSVNSRKWDYGTVTSLKYNF